MMHKHFSDSVVHLQDWYGSHAACTGPMLIFSQFIQILTKIFQNFTTIFFPFIFFLALTCSSQQPPAPFFLSFFQPFLNSFLLPNPRTAHLFSPYPFIFLLSLHAHTHTHKRERMRTRQRGWKSSWPCETKRKKKKREGMRRRNHRGFQPQVVVK